MNTPPLPLLVPRSWSPEQALAVWEILSELTDLIWAQYEVPIIESVQCDSTVRPSAALDQLDLFDPDGVLPF